MELEFIKLQGLGNDFIVVDDFSEEIELSVDQVRLFCDRHFGIGADGIILVRPSHNKDCIAFMHYINSDGSLAEMCGNGIRCLAKYLVDRGYATGNDNKFCIDTLAGPRVIRYTTNDRGKLILATVDMGIPKLSAADIPSTLKENARNSQDISFIKNQAVDSPWGSFEFTCVSMGNPHAVCFVENWELFSDEVFCNPESKSLASFNLNLVGAFFESNPIFPEKANIEFAEVKPDCIELRVFERGCGETLACGTGACATSVAASLTGRAACSNKIGLRGGMLDIEWNEANHVFMTGPALEVFTGTIRIYT